MKQYLLLTGAVFVLGSGLGVALGVKGYQKIIRSKGFKDYLAKELEPLFNEYEEIVKAEVIKELSR